MHVLLGVTGSVAAYKAAFLLRLLQKNAATVRVALTRSASRFVGAETFSGLTGEPPFGDLFGGSGEPHIELAEWADVVVVAPASADALSRIASGRAADPVSAVLSAFTGRVLLAPAMHPSMWGNRRVQSNVARLLEDPSYSLIGPVLGEVASGAHGLGRMAEPEQIAEAVLHAWRANETTSLRGRHVVVTAGPTEEPLDPVRVLTNRSTGKMGFSIAERAARRGARVSLITGPVALPTPPRVERTDVRTALELGAALRQLVDANGPVVDAVVMCAAVSDFRPEAESPTKLHRSEGDPLTLRLVPNPDLIAELGRTRKDGKPHLTAFALETGSWEETLARAAKKLTDKGVDLVVANSAAEALGTDRTRIAFVSRSGSSAPFLGDKGQAAERLLDEIERALGPGQ